MEAMYCGGRRAAAVIAVALLSGVVACGKEQPVKGSVIFIHPDGAGMSHYNAMRMLYYGPDGISNYDRLPEMAMYRSHVRDSLVASSPAGATIHAFGYKVAADGSFGTDGGQEISALSGFSGSIMKEAKAAGLAIGVVNDGTIYEPGTGAFLAEVDDRDKSDEIARQIMAAQPDVVLGGGEEHFLPAGVEGVHGPGERADGRNLIREAKANGYTVIRTRRELASLRARMAADPDSTPRRVLGLFAADATYNNEPEEEMAARGLLPYGAADPSAPGYDPPTAAEMTELALRVLRHTGRRFLLVTEVESTDDFGNDDNAPGTLLAARHADQTFGVALEYLERNPRTLIITAADSEAGGLEVLALDEDDRFMPVGTEDNNPVVDDGGEVLSSLAVETPLDGIDGRASLPFLSAPDALGRTWPFAIAWSGLSDFAGGIPTRAAGLHADRLRSPELARRFDNVDIYRMMYLTLFGRWLPYPAPPVAPEIRKLAPNPASTSLTP